MNVEGKKEWGGGGGGGEGGEEGVEREVLRK